MAWLGTVREGTGNGGSWKESFTSKKPEGGQIDTEHASFRARKDAMHAQDGGNDSNIEDRPGGDEPETEARPAMEEKEVNEGVKEEPGLEPRR